MSNKNKIVAAVSNTVIMLSILFASVSVLAAPITAPLNTQDQGITISPFLVELQVQKGQTQNESVELTNNSNRTLPINITVNDFVPTGENGEENYLNAGQGDPRYSLSSWIHISNSPAVILKPQGQIEIDYTITPPADADEGGHYGAILFSFISPGAAGTNVQVQQKVGTIILAKLGKVDEEGTISSFSTDKSFYQKLQ